MSKEAGAAATRPRYWPAIAAPSTVFLLLFFAFPFYVVIAVTFGSIDPILRQPVPAWNPTTWNPAILSFTLSNIVHSDGLYEAAFVHTFLFVGAATVLCLLIGYPMAYFLARRPGATRPCSWRCSWRRSGPRTCSGCSRGARCWPTTGT